jgi:murein DD-endopeptidase MepM/ murein hydrolase activator NlpD
MPEQPIDPFPNPKLCPTDAGLTNGGRYGWSRDDGETWHGGIDLAAPVGTDFQSIYSGKVTSVKNPLPTDPAYKQGIGVLIIVKTGAFSIKYGHLSEVKVKVGDDVAQGRVLGKTGKSGNAFNVANPHLHIEVSVTHFQTLYDRNDPEPYLKTKYEPPNPNNTTPPDPEVELS